MHPRLFPRFLFSIHESQVTSDECQTNFDVCQTASGRSQMASDRANRLADEHSEGQQCFECHGVHTIELRAKSSARRRLDCFMRV